MSPLGPTALLDADIFLYQGKGLLSLLIKVLDGTRYSHAGLFLGQRRDEVAEAVAEGVIAQSVAKSLHGRIGVDAFRLKSRPDMNPAITCADGYLRLGMKYATSTLVVCALLCLVRKVPIPLARAVFDRAAEALVKKIEAGKKSMICSEFVYRCYTEPFAAKGQQGLLSHIRTEPDPNSILATLTASNMTTMFSSPRVSQEPRKSKAVTRAAMAKIRAQDMPDDEADPELAVLIQDFLQDVEGKRQVRVSATQLPQLWSSAERFALRFLTASEAPEAARMLSLKARNVSYLELLAKYVPNFVTPGDLSKDIALRQEGSLDMNQW